MVRKIYSFNEYGCFIVAFFLMLGLELRQILYVPMIIRMVRGIANTGVIHPNRNKMLGISRYKSEPAVAILSNR